MKSKPIKLQQTKKLEKSKKMKKLGKQMKSSDDYSSSSVISDYDLLNERVVPLENFTSDPKLLLSEAIKCFKGNTFESLKPAVLSDWSIEDVKEKFYSYLENMSEATIVKIMNRNKSDDESSSSEEEASLQKNHVDSTTSNFATETPQPPALNPSTSASPPQQQDEEEEEDYVIEEEEVVDEVTEFEKLELLLRQRAIKSLQKKKSSAMN